jgi:hypothetical protein
VKKRFSEKTTLSGYDFCIVFALFCLLVRQTDLVKQLLAKKTILAKQRPSEKQF